MFRASVLFSILLLSHVTTATAQPHAAAVLRGSRHDPTAERLPRRLQEDPASTSTAPSDSTTTVVAAAAGGTADSLEVGTVEPNGTIAMVTTAVPSSLEAAGTTEGGADNLAMTTASPTASSTSSPTASPSATLVENAIASTNETSTEISDTNAAIPSPSSALPTLTAGNDNVTTLVTVAPTNNNESATSSSSSTTPPTSGGMAASPLNNAGQNVTENATSSTWTTATQSTIPAGNVSGGDDWFDGTSGNVTTTDDDAAGNYNYNYDDDGGGANDDWENTSGWNDHSPSRHPTPRPTYEYKPSEDDMLAATEMNPGEFSDDYIPSKGGSGGGGGTLQEKVASYLEGVESAEEMEQDRNVQIVAGVLTVVFVLLWLVTAQQTMENPDGLCASICRLTLKFLSCIGRILFLPCRYVCCKGSVEQGRNRRSHAPMRAPFPSDLELS